MKKLQDKSNFFPGCFFFCLLFVLHFCGVYLFSRGFFLTRYEIPTQSSCNDVRDAFPNLTLFRENRECWADPSIKKVIIILIDALRFEYTIFNESEPDPQPNQNKLPILHQLMKGQPEKTFLFRFRADPPTATMQRLKGILTGGLPTFIDIGENFASSQIREDNLVEQLLQQQFLITFIGDDTWEALFPEKFTKSYPYPSFNVKDITNGDIFTVSHLIPEITSKEPWDMIISHFLGVDHVGHRYHSNHPIMGEKLLQMNSIIGQVIETMDEETLFILMGDHGSTDDGNHGGATPDEVNSALFFYSKKPLKNSLVFHPFFSLEKGEWKGSLQSRTDFPTVSQIDLVPTLSLLLGVPIPYSNIGGIIPEILMKSDLPEDGIEKLWLDNYSSDSHPKNIARNASHYQNLLLESIENTNIGLLKNSWQIFRYLKDYSSLSSEFPAKMIHNFQSQLELINSELMSIMKVNSTSSVDLKSKWTRHVAIFRQYRQFQEEIGEICRELWVAFDLRSMILGLVVLGAALVIMGLYLAFDFVGQVSPWETLIAGIMGIVICTMSTTVLELSIPILVAGVIGISVGIIFTLTKPIKFTLRYPLSSVVSFDNMTSILFFICHSAALFGNSYIESEDKGVRFLIASYSIVLIVQSNFNPILLPKIILFAVLTRISAFCSGGIYESTAPFYLLLLKTIFPLVVLGLLVQLQYYTKLANSKLKIGNAILFGITGIFWILQHIGTWQYFPFLAKWMPRIVYIGSSAMIAFIYYQKNEGENVGPQHLKSSSIEILSFLIIPIILVTGLEGPLLGLLFFVQINILISILTHIPTAESIHIAMIWGLLVLQYFFASGHSFDFNGVHWAAAFVGFEDVNWIVGGLLMVLETWSSAFLLTVAVPILVSYVNPPQQLGTVTVYFGLFLFFFQTNSFLTSLFVFFARRHLMVWRVFAPKFLFESGQLLLLDLLIMLSIGFVSKMLKSNVKME